MGGNCSISSSDIFGSLFGCIDGLGTTIVQSLYQSLSSTLAPVFWGSAILWIAFWGYELVIGKVGVTPMLLVHRVLKLLIIYTFAYNWDTFSQWVVDGFNGMPDAIANAVCSSSGSSSCGDSGTSGISGILDSIWSAALAANKALMNASSWHSAGPALIAIVVIVVAAIMLTLAAALIVLSKVTLFLLLALAPIFISMALFQTTSRMYDGWVTVLFQNGLVLPAILYGIMGVMVNICQSTLQNLQQGADGGSSPNMDSIGPYILIVLSTVFLLVRSETIAHAIVGGARIGVVETVRKRVSQVAAAAAGPAGIATNLAQGAMDRAQDNIRNAAGRSARTEAHLHAARAPDGYNY